MLKVITIQFLAMLTMLIDHIGAVWFPEQAAWRIIGRLALPFYAYAIVLGYLRTRNLNRYLTRLGLLAVLSQLPYQLAFQTLEVNAIATLFVCLLLLLLLDRFKGQAIAQACLIAASIGLLEAIPFDYGAYAVLLVLIYRYSSLSWMVAAHLTLNIASLFVKGWVLQLFSLITTMFIVYSPNFISQLNRIQIPRLLWRSFYPVHLAVIAVIFHIMNH